MAKGKSSTSVLLPIYREIDRSMQGALKKFDVTCTKGCAACCDLLVVITSIEADALADRVVNDPALRKDVDAILVNLDRQEALLMAQAPGSEDIAVLRDVWWQARETCGLLDPETKLCRTYEYRPSPCRMHAVVSDPALCAKREPTITSALGQSRHDQMQLIRGLLAAANTAQLPFEVGTMPDMLASAIRRKLSLRKSPAGDAP